MSLKISEKNTKYAAETKQKYIVEDSKKYFWHHNYVLE